MLAAIAYDSFDEALAIANGTRYRLQAGVFTESIDAAMAFARGISWRDHDQLEASNFRIDAMPFGGVKSSGIGREGIRYAIDEFAELWLVDRIETPRADGPPRG